MKNTLKFGPMDAILSAQEEVTAQVEYTEEMPNVWLCHLVLTWPQAVSPQPITLHLHQPCRELYTQWDPVFRRARYMPRIETKAFESRLAA